MTENQDYLKLMAQKIVRHQNNWKDNPNKYTGLFMIITPILTPEQREAFNQKLKDFAFKHYGLRPESAERICYQYHAGFMRGHIYAKTRETGYNDFDTLKRTNVDVIEVERGLRDLSIWLLVTFKNICKEQGLRFNENEYSISDFSRGNTDII